MSRQPKRNNQQWEVHTNIRRLLDCSGTPGSTRPARLQKSHLAEESAAWDQKAALSPSPAVKFRHTGAKSKRLQPQAPTCVPKIKHARNTRIFLVDDQPIVRRGMEALLGRQPDMEICGQAGTVRDALRQIRSLQPDLAIVDLRLDGEDGLVLVSRLRASCPKLRILVFSMDARTCSIRAAFRSGADGYITKAKGHELLVEAVRRISEGRPFFTEHLAAGSV